MYYEESTRTYSIKGLTHWLWHSVYVWKRGGIFDAKILWFCFIKHGWWLLMLRYNFTLDCSRGSYDWRLQQCYLLFIYFLSIGTHGNFINFGSCSNVFIEKDLSSLKYRWYAHVKWVIGEGTTRLLLSRNIIPYLYVISLLFLCANTNHAS